MSSPSHWILGGCENSTLPGIETMHMSMYEVPAAFDPSLNTDTTGGGNTVIDIERYISSGAIMLWYTDLEQQVPPQDWAENV